MTRPSPPLTDRDIDVLANLESANFSKYCPVEWARPMDAGGQDGSHHSATLNKLARRGLVVVKQAHKFRPKRYRISDAGRAAIKAAKS